MTVKFDNGIYRVYDQIGNLIATCNFMSQVYKYI